MRLSEFIAEIKTSMKSYDSANLIDEISIHNWVIDELKRFGSNIMDLQEEVLFVKNGRTFLPDNYWHMRLAARVNITNFESLEEGTDVRFSRELYDEIERSATWSTTGESGEVTEKTYTKVVNIDKKRVELNMNQPVLLNITRGVQRKRLDYECINLSEKFRNKSPFDTVINNRTMQLNFRNGVVYIQYYGLMSEDGEIIIPETQHNRLKTYLEYYVKSRIIEDLIVNNDDPNKVNLLQYFDAKAKDQFDLAMTEAKFESLNWRETSKLMTNKNKRKMSTFENMFPSI